MSVTEHSLGSKMDAKAEVSLQTEARRSQKESRPKQWSREVIAYLSLPQYAAAENFLFPLCTVGACFMQWTPEILETRNFCRDGKL